ncbi:hypothetical protein Y032_0007g3261 [Ancylostoma ceylanicum]|uniref:Jun-like transcription factor domain-containing protein n=1 Tax=Ancylostoma ceylanicum TaxID=53326 RepID=A0A016VM68_9BILA|nr:hypothetical protein Y032_0007g3261 [Ancylostoma ceylanicum]
MDGEKGEFQALGGSLALDQKGEFQALRGTLSLDLSACKLRNPVPATSTATNNEPRTDPTLEQKQYAQGFLDALRTVQQIHNFEFEKKVLSPGFIAPLVSTEFLTPLISPSSRDYQAILNAMVAKTPIMQPMVGTSANSSLPTGFPTAMSVPGTSSTTAAGAAPSTSAPVTTAEQLVPPKVEIKQEPRCVSEDSTESDRSRSSSTATHNTRSNRTDLESRLFWIIWRLRPIPGAFMNPVEVCTYSRRFPRRFQASRSGRVSPAKRIILATSTATFH